MNLPSLPGRAAEAPSLGADRTPTLPRVNLLPPEIQEAARFRRFQLAMVAAGVAAVSVVGLLGYSAHHGVAKAQADLAAAQSENSHLHSQLASLQPVSDVYAQVDAKKKMLSQAMGPEIRWSYYLNDLSLKMPDHVWLTNINAVENLTGAPAAASAVGTSAGIGTVTFTGTAFAHDDVATWLDTLAKERGYTNAYFTNSSKTSMDDPKSLVGFTSSVTLSQAALSGRYKAEG